MKNTTGLYKHQRDNKGKRRKLRRGEPKAKLVPVKKYDYEKAREDEERLARCGKESWSDG